MHHSVSAGRVIAANDNAHFRIVIPAVKSLQACVPRFGAHALNLAGAGVFAQAPIHRPNRKKSDEIWYEDAKWHSRAVGLSFETEKLEGEIATAWCTGVEESSACSFRCSMLL